MVKQSNPPGRTLHCYRHDEPYVGQCPSCVADLLQGGSYRAGPRPKLSTEQVHAELRRLRPGNTWTSAQIAGLRELIDQLPRVDVVEECASACASSGYVGYEFSKLEPRFQDEFRNLAKAVIRKYIELRGLPADPELEGE